MSIPWCKILCCLIGANLLEMLTVVSSFGLNQLFTRQPPRMGAPSRGHGISSSTILWATINPDGNLEQQKILCDLQTVLRLSNSVGSGGEAKMVIQSGECLLNGRVETRRAKKLVAGDVVEFQGQTLDVQKIVDKKGYVFKAKQKKG